MNAPETLYFQDLILDWDMSYERLHTDDIEYVRADLYEELRAALESSKAGIRMTIGQLNGFRHLRNAVDRAEERAKALKAENDRLRSIVTVYVREKLAQEMNVDRLH